MKTECDVLVVGGGPAGSSAARAAAKNGANTILIEKEKKPGKVSCAEAIGTYLFPLLPFKIPKNQQIWKINGMIFSDGKEKIVQKGTSFKAWSLNRENFDNWMLKNAQSIGVKTWMGTELSDIKVTKDFDIKEVIVKKGDEIKSIVPSYIIAADGVESTVGEKLGLIKKNSNNIGHVYSWEMENLTLNDPDMELIYFGDFAPRAYAYVFPKSANTANIGVGSTKGDKDLEKHFNRFIKEIIPNQTKNAIKTVERSGKAPIQNTISKLRYGNILFTGDAANQNFKPYLEGILPSIICGDIAGRAVCSKDKMDYENAIKRKLGNQFRSSEIIFNKFYEIDKLDNKKRNLLNMYLFSFMDVEKIDVLVKKDIIEIKKELKRKSSGIYHFITMLRYFIWYSKVLATRSD
jgi:digeranylgeranylglycerophospholipid reductase